MHYRKFRNSQIIYQELILRVKSNLRKSFNLIEYEFNLV